MSDTDHDERFKRNEDRLKRLEIQFWGTEDNPDRGMVHRLMMTEAIAMELKSYAQKMMWLLIAIVGAALLNLVINKNGAPPAANQSTSVITSDAAKGIGASAASRREYFIVSEVAIREGKSERTIIDWIETGRIQPAPTKEGKEWRIAASYRIPPQLAASSGTAQTEP